jgi:hypothetical protein
LPNDWRFLRFRDGGFALLEKPASSQQVIRRFQIEDLIVQDASGVVFRAHDSETGRTVAIRRFFPFGAQGGGLHAEEQTAYEIAVRRLADIHHPALRSVVCGGCDPIDGMPFIATEWVEGEPLDELLGDGTLPVEAATLLISQALEVCELLSHVLAEEAVWVETSLSTVIVSDKESGRGFTFWISPLKWLGNGDNRGLESIIALAEEVMGWKGRIVSDQAGRGLGGWLKWLRGAVDSTSLHEARQMLAASVGAEPPPPARNLVARATRPVRPIKPPSSKTPLLITLALGLVVAGAAGWFLTRKPPAAPVTASATAPNPPPKPKSPPRTARAPAGSAAPQAEPPVPESVPDEVARANQRALELSAQVEASEQQVTASLLSQQAEVNAKAGVFSAHHRELLLQQVDQVVTVEGVCRAIEFSQGGNWMYLVLQAPNQGTAARGKIVVADAPDDLKEEAVKPLVGKTLRLRGKVETQGSRGGSRPLILLPNRASIEVLP